MAAAELKTAGVLDDDGEYDDSQAFDALEKDFQRVSLLCVGRPPPRPSCEALAVGCGSRYSLPGQNDS